MKRTELHEKRRQLRFAQTMLKRWERDIEDKRQQRLDNIARLTLEVLTLEEAENA